MPLDALMLRGGIEEMGSLVRYGFICEGEFLCKALLMLGFSDGFCNFTPTTVGTEVAVTCRSDDCIFTGDSELPL